MNYFSNNGEMNASSMKDMLTQLTKYASILQENLPANQSMSGQPSLSDAQRDDLISRAINTQDGKIALAQAMANPINS